MPQFEYDEKGQRLPPVPIDPTKYRTVACKNFARGACHFGENCNFLHTMDPELLARIVCRQWRQGLCARGMRCRMLHSNDPAVLNHVNWISGRPSMPMASMQR